MQVCWLARVKGIYFSFLARRALAPYATSPVNRDISGQRSNFELRGTVSDIGSLPARPFHWASASLTVPPTSARLGKHAQRKRWLDVDNAP